MNRSPSSNEISNDEKENWFVPTSDPIENEEYESQKESYWAEHRQSLDFIINDGYSVSDCFVIRPMF